MRVRIKCVVPFRRMLASPYIIWISYTTPTSHRELFGAGAGLGQHLMSNCGCRLGRAGVSFCQSVSGPSGLVAGGVASAGGTTGIPFMESQVSGHGVADPQDIADSFSDFYTNLYN